MVGTPKGTEQDYFADGTTEEIITALARFKNLFVIASNSSFTYRNRLVDIKQVAATAGRRSTASRIAMAVDATKALSAKVAGK